MDRCGRGQHGDLLDLIAAARGLDGIGAALDEARRFLGLPRSAPFPRSGRSATGETFSSRTALAAVPAGTAEVARRLFRRSTPIAGTIAETYLRARGIAVTPDMTALRFHPRCWYRQEADSPKDARDTWPALIAAVSDKDGGITGVQLTCSIRPAVPRRRWACRAGP